MTNQDRRYVVNRCIKKRKTCFIHGTLIVDSVWKHICKLNENELIEFHDDVFREGVGEYESRKSHKVYEEMEHDMMFPITHNGKSYSEEDCDDMFLAYYVGVEALNAENGVYVADGTWVTPDGNLTKW